MKSDMLDDLFYIECSCLSKEHMMTAYIEKEYGYISLGFKTPRLIDRIKHLIRGISDLDIVIDEWNVKALKSIIEKIDDLYYAGSL